MAVLQPQRGTWFTGSSVAWDGTDHVAAVGEVQAKSGALGVPVFKEVRLDRPEYFLFRHPTIPDLSELGGREATLGVHDEAERTFLNAAGELREGSADVAGTTVFGGAHGGASCGGHARAFQGGFGVPPCCGGLGDGVITRVLDGYAQVVHDL